MTLIDTLKERQARRRSERESTLIVQKHSLAVRWFHWINFPVMMIMVWSGLLIYWANDIYQIRIGDHVYAKLFSFGNAQDPDWLYKRFSVDHRLAEGMGWHFTFMWVFAINGLLYVLYLIFSKEWKLIVPGKSSIKDAIHTVLYDAYLRRDPGPRKKFNGAQQFAYTGVILMGAGMLLTGVAIYKPVQASWFTQLLGGYPTARLIHFWITALFVLFFLVHVFQVVRAGWNNFRAMITGVEVVPPEPSSPIDERDTREVA